MPPAVLNAVHDNLCPIVIGYACPAMDRSAAYASDCPLIYSVTDMILTAQHTHAHVATAWTVCQAGEFVATAGTATADRACTTCAAGELIDLQQPSLASLVTLPHASAWLPKISSQTDC